jgi:3-methyladenine DNA glycosylase AlkD
VWRNGGVYEVLCAPLFFLGLREVTKEPFQYWPLVKKWATKIENWVHSDSLCSFYTRCLYANPSMVYPEFVGWNKSNNPWLQRISIVSLLYYSRQRDAVLHFQELIALVNPLLESSHPYVQKGVGWTLREIGNVYPRETYDYLMRNVSRLAPVSYSYATEKLEGAKKERLVTARKKQRKSGD